MFTVEQIENTCSTLAKVAKKKFIIDGVEVEKGSLMTKKRIEENYELYTKWLEHWINYPDLFVDLITPRSSKFSLKLFQRAFLRACLRHGRVDTIAPRAAGKSFICVLALILISVFRPGSHQFMCSPGKQQSVKIASAKIQQIFELLPLLKKEVLIEKKSNDYYTLIFRNTSILDILTPLNSTRGNRANCGILDEYRKTVAVLKSLKLRERP